MVQSISFPGNTVREVEELLAILQKDLARNCTVFKSSKRNTLIPFSSISISKRGIPK